MSESPQASETAAPSPRGTFDVLAAQTRFQSLSRRRQVRLIAELLLTRSEELLRAYPALLSIGQGFRRRRQAGGNGVGEIVTTDRCVLFLVRRKWKRGGSPKRRLPSHLYCHDVIAGRRTLLAIPTDVSEARDLRAHAGLQAIDVAELADHGVLTCLVDCQLEDGGIVRRALSCRHVLSLTGIRSPEPVKLPVSLNGHRIGETLPVRGPLDQNQPASFDAQIMDIHDPVSIGDCLWTTRWPRGHARHAGEFEASMWLQLPRADGTVRVKYRGVWPVMRVSYGSGAGSFDANVGPLLELELVGAQTTRPGDSGSPLVIGFAKPKLAGMHIAGDPDDGQGRALSYCIPAYALLDPRNYAEAHEQKWELPRH